MDTTILIRVIAGLIAVFVFLPVVIIPYWKIFSKAGFSGWLSLLILIPFVNLIILYVVAFSEWKVRNSDLGEQRHGGSARRACNDITSAQCTEVLVPEVRIWRVGASSE